MTAPHRSRSIAGTLTALALTAGANAGVVSWEGRLEATDGNDVRVDLNGDGDEDIFLRYEGASLSGSTSFRATLGQYLTQTYWKPAFAGSSFLDRFADGEDIGTFSNLTTSALAGLRFSGGQPDGEFIDMTRGFVAFKANFGGAYHYGWAEIAIENPNPTTGKLVLFGWAWNETAEEPIPAGAVPAPAGLTVLGAGGALAVRRRR